MGQRTEWGFQGRHGRFSSNSGSKNNAATMKLRGVAVDDDDDDAGGGVGLEMGDGALTAVDDGVVGARVLLLMVDWPGANVGRSIVVVVCGILVLVVVVLPDGLPPGAIDGDDGSGAAVEVPFMTTPGGPPVGASVPTT
jgi:hypothetical protein